MKLSLYLRNRFLRIPASFKSPSRIISSMWVYEDTFMCRICCRPSIQCSLPSSSTTRILPDSEYWTVAPTATENSVFFGGSSQTWSPCKKMKDLILFCRRQVLNMEFIFRTLIVHSAPSCASQPISSHRYLNFWPIN